MCLKVRGDFFFSAPPIALGHLIMMQIVDLSNIHNFVQELERVSMEALYVDIEIDLSIQSSASIYYVKRILSFNQHNFIILLKNSSSKALVLYAISSTHRYLFFILSRLLLHDTRLTIPVYQVSTLVHT